MRKNLYLNEMSDATLEIIAGRSVPVWLGDDDASHAAWDVVQRRREDDGEAAIARQILDERHGLAGLAVAA